MQDYIQYLTCVEQSLSTAPIIADTSDELPGVNFITESVPYEVIGKVGPLEVRKYPVVLLAMVRGYDDNDAFRLLFDYISGRNKTGSKVAMTVPVVSATSTSEKIAMTAPVISDERSFSFAMPSEYTLATLPRPEDERVQIVEIPGRTVAAMRFSGRTTDDSVKRKTKELLSELQRSGVRAMGEPYLMRYNSPFMPSFLRRNEVAVEIEMR